MANELPQKAEFVEKVQGRLAVIKRDLDQIDAQIKRYSAAIKANLRPGIQTSHKQAVQLNKQLEDATTVRFQAAGEAVNGAFQQAPNR